MLQALSRQDVTQQLKERMDQFATRVRVLEAEIAAVQKAEHAAFSQEQQFWEGTLRAARDKYELEMEALETKYFGVCRQAHIVVPADMILMKKTRKTERSVLEGHEAEHTAAALKKKAGNYESMQQRLERSNQEHSRVWKGKAVQLEMQQGDDSVSALTRKVAEARVRSSIANQTFAGRTQPPDQQFTSQHALTTDSLAGNSQLSVGKRGLPAQYGFTRPPALLKENL